MKGATRPLRVCLVGSEQQENLGLGYLAAAAEQAGHAVEIVAYESRLELDAAVATILAARPDVVGLSMAFQHLVEDTLILARTLRARGFAGHLTCGGHVPTFCHDELLRDVAAIDSVVRFEGERTLVELLDRIARSVALDAIADLVRRDGERVVCGPPGRLCTDLDALPLPRRRAQPFLIGGIPMAFVITARGCPGDCSYCCLHAFSHAAGGPALRLRDPTQVAAEIALLRRERGVRVVVVQDDLFVLPSEAKSVARMDALGSALKERGVTDVVFWVKGRPDDISGPVLEALRRMGAIHLFLGVENAVPERLRYLGRTHRPADNHRALRLCREHGLRASFNLMLFDPDCSLAEVAATLDMAADHLDATWNVCRTEIYSGTRLFAQLVAEGRLVGDYRGYDYRMTDPRAELAFRLLRSSMHERAFACDSLVNRVISLSFARQVHERLLPGRAAQALSQQVDLLCDEVYRDTVALLRGAVDYAAGANLADRAAIHEHAATVALDVLARDARLGARAADLWQRLTARGRALTAARATAGDRGAR